MPRALFYKILKALYKTLISTIDSHIYIEQPPDPSTLNYRLIFYCLIRDRITFTQKGQVVVKTDTPSISLPLLF